MKLTSIQIAAICHEANREFTRHIGDVPVQPPWEQEDPGIRNSCINGVAFNLDNPDAPPSASHDSWLRQKIADGWKWGPTKDVEKKTHPAMVPYGDLPEAVKRKDALFKNIVAALRPLIALVLAFFLLTPTAALANVPTSAPGYRVASAATLPQRLPPLVLEQADAPPAPTVAVPHVDMVDVVFGALTLVLGLLGRFLFGKSGESKVAATLELVTTAISAAVAEANVTLKPKLKSFLADGKVDEAEAKELKDDVVRLVQSKLPPGIWRTIVGVFGGLADTWLRGEIEKAVIEQKAAAAAAKVVTPKDAAAVLGAES